ncbi:hypothetical protein B0H16DRAFT_1516815 [Mycena metata]|uniref:NACHT domain-containing protein n=1 Tax=Mycena metata TaxID=1033252 RepID=A0AAD7JQP3_9AGAR|nr:hypothetical protein B0H16DRAFT_1516815 [Mycena metata]
MPRQNSSSEVRIKNITACLTPALTLLNELNDAFGSPFIVPIVKTVQALIAGVQSVKRNKDECLQLLESIHPVLYSIVHLHLKSKIIGSLSPPVLKDIEMFTQTLHKIYMFLGTQQDGNKIKQFFRQNEVNGMLNDCHAGLDQAIEVFKGHSGLALLKDVMEVQNKAAIMHKELLEIVSTLSDETLSDWSSAMVYHWTNTFQNSSNSFSMLPSKPKIFYGRESETKEIMKILLQKAPRIAVLGGGGMGKTTLARTVLHHADTCAKFEHRYFVSADTATTAVELAALIAFHLGLDPGADLTRPVVQYLARQTGSSLLILDNLETPWETTQSRQGVEDFLSLLADVGHLGLMVTLRGSERPAKVRWTRPFLQPLQPLSNEAAQHIFEEITDDSHSSDEKAQLLEFTENMPLAIDLMAHLVEYEGLSTVLVRWKTEKTSLLSTGYDRHSNLDTSIAMSVSSPRITHGARELLSLLSILPNGLSDVELVQNRLPINDILSCKSVLIATSLAYRDTNNRLRSLVLIREHVQKFYPPSELLVQSIRKSFHDLLAFYERHKDAQMKSILAQITANLANLDEVLRQGLKPGLPDILDTIQCTLRLNGFYRLTRDVGTHLLDEIPVDQCDHPMMLLYIIERLSLFYACTPKMAQELVSQAISLLEHVHNPILKIRFYMIAGASSRRLRHESEAVQFFEKALALSQSSSNTRGECDSLDSLAFLRWKTGDFQQALVLGRQAEELAYQTTDLVQASQTLYSIATSLISLGHYPAAMVEVNRARELLDICGMADTMLHRKFASLRAGIHLEKAEYAEAKSIYITQIQDTGLEQNSYSYAFALLNMAVVDVSIGVPAETVLQNLSEVRRIFTDMKVLWPISYCDAVLADLRLREGDTTSALTLFEQCIKANWAKEIDAVTYCLERLADISRWPLKFYGSITWPVIYLCQSHKSKGKLGLYKALFFIGELLVDEDEATAQSLFILALEGFSFMDVHRSRAQCMMQLGNLSYRNREHTRATELWSSARPLFERSLQTKDVAQVDSRVASLHQASLEQLATLDPPVSKLVEPFEHLYSTDERVAVVM